MGQTMALGTTLPMDRMVTAAMATGMEATTSQAMAAATQTAAATGNPRCTATCTPGGRGGSSSRGTTSAKVCARQ